MKKSFLLLLSGFFFLLNISPISSEEISKVSIQSLDLSEYPIVKLFYNTTDKNGKYQNGFSEDEVQLFEDEMYNKVWGDGDYDHAKSNIVMIIDSSGSMRGVMDKVLSAASSLLNKMDNADRIMLVDFDSTVKPLTDFTKDKDDLLNNLSRIKAGGATSLYDSITIGLNRLLTNPDKNGGLNLIVLLTDGKDENASGGPGSKTSFSQLKNLLESSRIPVYSIGLGSNVDKNTLGSISKISGGKAFYAEDTEKLANIYRDIIGYIHSLHIFQYVTGNGKWDGTKREVLLYFKELDKAQKLEYKAPTVDKISGSLNMYGNLVEKSDMKGADIKWSYCFEPFGGESGRFISNLAITPDGKYIIDGSVLGILNVYGERLFLATYDSLDTFNMNVSNHLYQYTHGYGIYGETYFIDNVRKLKDLATIKKEKPENVEMPGLNYPALLNAAKGSFHKEWLKIEHSYEPVSISKNGRFIVLAARPEDQKYKFYFLLYDRENKEIPWERGVFNLWGDSAEPGAVKVSDNGFTLIIQDHNIAGVDKTGTIKLNLMWEKTGMRFSRLDINSSGNAFAGYYDYKHSTRFGYFEIPASNDTGNKIESLKPVFSVEAEPNDSPGCISISQNGKYLAFNDRYGPKIYDNSGKLIWSLKFKNPIHSYNKGNGIYVIDNGTFVFSEANRFYYGQLVQ